MAHERDLKNRIEQLRKLIAYHQALYHTFDAPELSDAAYDALVRELAALEKERPQWGKGSSVTQRIGAKPLDAFVKVWHEVPMLSFNDAFSEEEMHEWFVRLENYVGKKIIGTKKNPLFYGELKIDGLAIELTYRKGVLVQGSTRGDGKVGEDVTQNIMTIATIPHTLERMGAWHIPDTVIIRGEVFINHQELERINREQKAQGLKPYANVRNLAAGSLRQLDSAITASRNLASFQYDIVRGLPALVTTHEQVHKVLASWGCTVNPHNKAVANMEEVFAFRDTWEKRRTKLTYDIDGVVIIVNDNRTWADAGVVGKSPRGAIAYKFAPREATTILKDVQVQVGRTGVLTPVATLEPVQVGGITITHATLHNFDEIKRLDVKIGDTVVVTRSGDVIPKITRVIEELRTGKEKTIRVPRTCPVDGSPVVQDGVFVRCSNPRCGARNRNHIIHFVSRAAFDIRGLGESIIDRFLDEGLIATAADIFLLTEGDVVALERFGKKSAHNIITEVQSKKQVSLDRFLYALGIPQVGEQTAAALAAKMLQTHTVISTPLAVGNNIRSYAIADLETISDVGPKVAQSIYEWFADGVNIDLLKQLETAGVGITPPPRASSQLLGGMYVCITGTLATMSRQRAKELIIQHGGHVESSITERTTVVLVGENPGSKYQQAVAKKIPVWTEEEFVGKVRG